MAVLRKVARPLLASVFVQAGVNTLREPARVVPAAETVVAPLAARFPSLPRDVEQAVRVNSAVQVGAGVLLATGRLPRLAALALAGSLVPTTLAGHAFWNHEDPQQRAQHRIHFLKNLSVLGGLLVAVSDASGRSTRRCRRSGGRSHHGSRPACPGAARARAGAHRLRERLPVG